MSSDVSCDISTDISDGYTSLRYTDGANVIDMCNDDMRYEVHTVGGLDSQMHYKCWEYYVGFDPDIVNGTYLLSGKKNGFPIVDADVEIEPYRCVNYSSILHGDAFDYVNDLIRDEILDGKYVRATCLPHCVHALGVVPKADGSFRPITDCKRPLGVSINNYMEETFQHFTYCTVDQVAENMLEGCYMASVEIASAYRSVPILPEHWKYQAISWMVDGEISDLFDTRLCFGLRCAPYIFTMISNFVSETMERLGYLHVVNYIDDFLVYGKNFEECQQAQTVLIHLLGQLGFRVSWKKCSTPSTKVRYLGIDFNSISMEISLPESKLIKLRSEMDFFRDKTRATKKQLQRLCGILSHSSKVIKGGRTFSRRVIDLLKGLSEGNPRIRLSDDFRKDLYWWDQFAEKFNGKEKIIHSTNGSQVHVFTDSCLEGYGLVVGTDWQAGFFNSSSLPQGHDLLAQCHKHWENVCVVDQTNINYLELMPVVAALRRYAPHWKDLHAIIFSDNTQVVSMINKGVSANADCMDHIREMFWITAGNNIYLTARHIPGFLNILPDMLSHVYHNNSLEFLQGFDLCCRRLEAD